MGQESFKMFVGQIFIRGQEKVTVKSAQTEEVFRAKCDPTFPILSFPLASLKVFKTTQLTLAA